MKTSKKYNDIMVAARKLFFRYGLKKVSVEEICTEANVSKMTFYKFFQNKTETAKKIIDNFYEEAIEQFQIIIKDESLSMLDKVNKWLEIKKKSMNGAGKDFIYEIFMGRDEEMVEYLESWAKKASDTFLNFIKNAQERAWIRKELNPELLLIIIDKLNNITYDERLLEIYGDNISNVTYDITKLFLFGALEDNTFIRK